MKIKSMKVNGNFKYLWLKKVTGIDLNTHCARCLLGDYLGIVNSRTREIKEADLENGIYYLCGVAYPYDWNANFHLAFRDGQGNVKVDMNGIEIELEGVEILPINQNAALLVNHPKIKYKSYHTCRNWQFANWLYQSGIFTS